MVNNETKPKKTSKTIKKQAPNTKVKTKIKATITQAIMINHWQKGRRLEK